MRCLSTASIASANRVPSGEKEERTEDVSDGEGWARAEVDVGRLLEGLGREAEDFFVDDIFITLKRRQEYSVDGLNFFVANINLHT